MESSNRLEKARSTPEVISEHEFTALAIHHADVVPFGNAVIQVTPEELSTVFRKAFDVLLDHEAEQIIRVDATRPPEHRPTLRQRVGRLFGKKMEQMTVPEHDVARQELAATQHVRRLVEELGNLYQKMGALSTLSAENRTLLNKTLIKGRSLLMLIAENKRDSLAYQTSLQEVEQLLLRIQTHDPIVVEIQQQEEMLLYQQDIFERIDACRVHSKVKQQLAPDEQSPVSLTSIEDQLRTLFDQCKSDLSLFRKPILTPYKDAIERDLRAYEAWCSILTPEKYSDGIESQLEKDIHLKEQYELGVRVLRKRQGLRREKQADGFFTTVPGEVGVITKLSTGVEGIVGIDGKEYPTPTYDQLARHINERCAREPAFAHKFKQGMTRMILEPFAAPLHEKALLYESLLLEKHAQGALYRAQAEPTTPSEDQKITRRKTQRALHVANEYTTDGSDNQNGTGILGADTEGKLLYEPTDIQKNAGTWQVVGGKTKRAMLEEEANTFPGWNVYFVEENPIIPARGEVKKSREGRVSIQAGDSPQNYMKTMQTDAQYALETGMTVDSWLMFASLMAEQYGQVVDEMHGTGKMCYLTGSIFTSGRVPNGHWLQSSARAGLIGAYPDYDSESSGLRPVVKA